MSYNLNGAIQGGSVVLSRAGGTTANISAVTGAATTYTIQNVTYSNQGKLYYKATATGAVTPTTNAASSSAVAANASSGAAFIAMVTLQPVAGSTVTFTGSACTFVWGLDPSGNVRVAQGRIVNYIDTTTGSTVAPLPTLPDWFTPVAYTVAQLTLSTASTWLFGTSNWNQTGLTLTTVDLIALPSADPFTA
jgi:hypothetical protein